MLIVKIVLPEAASCLMPSVLLAEEDAWVSVDDLIFVKVVCSTVVKCMLI